MTPETEANISEAINWLQQTGSQIQGFAIEQAPLYCQEVIAWTLWSSVFWASVGLVILVTGIVAARKGSKIFQDNPWNDEALVPVIGGWTMSVVGAVMVTFNTSTTIKAIVAPRIVIIEHLSGLKP